jgi:hypothetical protein
VKVYENMDVLPRAFVVHAALVAPDTWDGTELALNLMRDPRFGPANTVIINSDSQEVVDYAIGRHLWWDAAPVAEIVEYTPMRVVVEVEASRPGYLVLTDAYYPGWRAESDGEPVAIYRADVMFRAVPIHEGQQTIVFTFKPFAIPFGWQIAAVGAMTLLLAAVSVSSVRRQPDNRIRLRDDRVTVLSSPTHATTRSNLCLFSLKIRNGLQSSPT